jgi:hypothetical protein
VAKTQSLHKGGINSIDDLIAAQRDGWNRLSNELSNELTNIASVIEWGFGQVTWELEQQTKVLQSIDQTLRSPSETQANEWRRMAEELRGRGVLDKSEELFLKALDLNPLDYRLYVGLAHTYLAMSQFDKARMMLERSLPHAPSSGPRSYSYRLIGRTYFCDEDYRSAAVALESAIEASPSYLVAHYDHAQYCALSGEGNRAITPLQKAILGQPLYWYWAERETNFDPLRGQVEDLRYRMNVAAKGRATSRIDEVESYLQRWVLQGKISRAREALATSRDKAELGSIAELQQAHATLQRAKARIASGDYIGFLDALPLADEAYALATSAEATADREISHCHNRRSERIPDAWGKVQTLLWYPLVGAFVGFMAGALVTVIVGGVMGMTMGIIEENEYDTVIYIGGAIGACLGALGGIWQAVSDIRSKLND